MPSLLCTVRPSAPHPLLVEAGTSAECNHIPDQCLEALVSSRARERKTNNIPGVCVQLRPTGQVSLRHEPPLETEVQISWVQRLGSSLQGASITWWCRGECAPSLETSAPILSLSLVSLQFSATPLCPLLPKSSTPSSGHMTLFFFRPLA